MSLSWIAGTTGSYGTGSSGSATTPAGIADDDGLYALVCTSNPGRLPTLSGWTRVDYHQHPNSPTATISLMKKDTVVAANSSTSYSFSFGGSCAYSISYFVLRATVGPISCAEFFGGNFLGGTYTAIPMLARTAVYNGEMFIMSAYLPAAASPGGFLDGYPTAPTGATLWTDVAGGSPDVEYFAGAYQSRNSGQQNATDGFGLHATGVTVDGSIRLVMRFQDDGDTSTLYEDTLSDGFGVMPVLTSGLETAEATDDIGVSVRQLLAPLRFGITADEYIDLAPDLTWLPGAVVREGIGILAAELPKLKYGVTLSRIIGVLEDHRVSIPKTVAETIGVDPAVTVANGVRLLETLGIAPVLTPNATYGRTVADTIRLLDTLRRFVDGTISETFGIEPVDTPAWAFMRVLEDGVGIEPLLTPQMLLRVEASDEIGIADDQLLNAIFAGVLSEEVQVSAAYIAPNGNFTTWAINTNTGAISEYSNFVFNSFAQMGQKYLGANSGGLYELNGDDDEGDAIIARIKTGFMQFGGAQFAGFKGAYLGIRGTGDFYLKIETGDGKSYTYKVTVENMKTAKVQIGKGVRARYFSFELYSVGQDFDLESIEFIPVVASRRV